MNNSNENVPNPYRGKITRIQADLYKREEVHRNELGKFRKRKKARYPELLAALKHMDSYIHWPYFAKKYPFKAVLDTLPPEERRNAAVQPMLLDIESFGPSSLKSFLNLANRGRARGIQSALRGQMLDALRDVRDAALDLKRLRSEKRRFLFKRDNESKVDNLEDLQRRAQARHRKLLEELKVEEADVESARVVLRTYLKDWDRVCKKAEAVAKLRGQIDAERPFLETHELAYEKAAALDGKSRSNARSVADTIPKTKWCPYCGGPLGTEPHADHIYPVSKGGLSIKENIVWCCSQCNLRKSDKGLTSFLSEIGAEIGPVLEKLKKLGKHV